MNPQTLLDRIYEKKSFLCIGLDPDLSKLPSCLGRQDPAEAILEFNQQIIQATLPYSVAYKPNLAFYESLGTVGYEVLNETLKYIPSEVFVIADAKRGDIGNTSSMYAKAVYDLPGVDAITVAPYMGKDSVMPFLDFKDKWVFLLALTSNPGAQDFQFLMSGGKRMYEWVMTQSLHWEAESQGYLGFVAGATHPENMPALRALAPDSFFLVPGVGAQGGEIEPVIQHLAPRLLINAGRQVLYASSGADYAVAAEREARNLQMAFQFFFQKN
jgi:orotidine-5'-phosphate decarboxylase